MRPSSEYRALIDANNARRVVLDSEVAHRRELLAPLNAEVDKLEKQLQLEESDAGRTALKAMNAERVRLDSEIADRRRELANLNSTVHALEKQFQAAEAAEAQAASRGD